MGQQIFRQAALERLASPEQLDLLMQVTSPRAWLGLAALLVILFAALVWGIFGTVWTTIEGPGILLRPGGVRTVVAPARGVVTNVVVFPGDEIYKGTPVARLSLPAAGDQRKTETVVSTASGRVLDVPVKENNLVEQGSVLIIVEPTDTRLEAIIFIPLAEGRKVQPGMRIEITPSTVKKKELGYILGEVTSVGAFPASRQGMMRTLENEELVGSLSASGPPLQIMATLLPDPNTPTGYRWSSSQAARYPLTSGTLCQVTIRVREQRPISLLVPTVRDLLGF